MNNIITNYASPETGGLNEDQWLNALFLISDTQTWLDEMQARLMHQLPVKNRKKLLRKAHYLTATALAHILERHYYKIHRYPNTGKFTISIAAIVCCIRDAIDQPAAPVPNSGNLQRIADTGQHIGFDQYGRTTNIITVLSDAGGKIITAFPGTLNHTS
ncbi:MAG TPA: hypothetical protein VFW07_28350 [Parafilimonas sp.]|nr:hypothetical protein [Parafilimonas sp.]